MTKPARALATARAEAAECRACPLWAGATQTVFGEGPVPAALMLVGEQPGDREDEGGHPFIGPAGRELDLALDAAGIERSEVYLTNAVKHFKYERRGKRRIHQKPNAEEVTACHPWLDTELALVAPKVVVALGAVAVRALLGRPATITSLRGTTVPIGDAQGIVTIHPSAILRADEDRAEMRAAFVADLQRAAELSVTTQTHRPSVS